MKASTPSLFSQPRTRQLPVLTAKHHKPPPAKRKPARLPRQPTLGDLKRSVCIPPVQGPKPLPRSASNQARLPLTPSVQPTNHILRCAYKSQAGLKSQKQRGCNQDEMLVMPHLQGIRYQYLFAVFDGHGAFGHEVSGQAKRCLQSYLEEGLLHTGNQGVLVTALRQAIHRTATAIETLHFNTAYSGTTLTAVLVSSKDVICANIGDSRAVLGKLVGSVWTGVELTTDHKPSVDEERARILNCHGKIHPLYDSSEQPVGPERVWIETDDVPGLAMTRSIGDQVAHTVGVISEPELTCYKLTPEDKFLIVATDGLWEVLSTQAAVECVAAELRKGSMDRCCTELIKEASLKWEESGHSADDITIIVVFLA